MRRVDLGAHPDASVAELPSLADGPRWVITLLRAGDHSRHLPARRRQTFLSLGIDPERVYALRQVHSRDVWATAEVGSDRGLGREGDGLITADPQAVLSVTVADCLPILLVDRRTGAWGLCHSGWKGTGIVTVALKRMGELFGSRAEEMAACIGPGIGACCYAVPAERYEWFGAEFGAGSVAAHDGVFTLDLRAANVDLLTQAGIADITVVCDCTRCNPLLSSYRRQGHEGYAGMLALAGGF